MVQSYKCPTCGFPELEEPAWDPNTGVPSFDICPCCGCEFGYDDATPEARERYRKQWISNGALWFEPRLKPVGWNLREQLYGIGYPLDIDVEFSATECSNSP